MTFGLTADAITVRRILLNWASDHTDTHPDHIVTVRVDSHVDVEVKCLMCNRRKGILT